jgi:antitoxin component YwqK of YwqJK toxin-antitoxin module
MIKPFTILAMASAVSVAQAGVPQLECPVGSTPAGYDTPQYSEQCCQKSGADGQLVRDGPHVSRYADGTVSERGSFRDGQRHGVHRQWHPNGARSSEVTYRDGNREGVERNWSESGVLTERVSWRGGRQHGRFEEWSWENGVKVSDGEYLEDRPAGHWVHWNGSSGQLFGVFEYDPNSIGAGDVETLFELRAPSRQSIPPPAPASGEARGSQCVVVPQEQPVVMTAVAAAAPYPMLASQAPPPPTALPDCPTGAEIQGAPPPVGDRQWCARPIAEGEWQRHGPRLDWHANGTVAALREFRSDRPDGTWWYFADDGKAEAFLTFHEGRLSGPAMSWYPDGNPAAHACYDGVPHGETWSWHLDGTLVSRVEHRDGYLDGLWRTWHANGNPESRGEYLQGKQNGEWRWWRADRSPDSVASFRDAALDGTATRYWPSGARWFVGSYLAGARVGSWKFNYENGSPAGEGMYVDGKRSGSWKLWPSTGGPVQTVEFDAGEPVAGTAQSSAACRPLPEYPGECYRLGITPGLEPRMDPDDVARDVLAFARHGQEPGDAPPFRNLRISAFIQRRSYSSPNQDHSDPGWIWLDESAADINWVARADGKALVPIRAPGGFDRKSGWMMLSDRTGLRIGGGTP